MFKKRSWLLVLLGLLGLGALLLACAAPSEKVATPTPGGKGTPVVLPTKTPLPAGLPVVYHSPPGGLKGSEGYNNSQRPMTDDNRLIAS